MNSNKKSQNVFAHSSSLQMLWRCASNRRVVTKTLIYSNSFKTIYHDVLQYVNSKNRRRSPISLVLDSHLLLGVVYVYSKTVFLWHQDVEKLYKDAIVHRFFEFDTPVKSKMTRKKEAILANNQWQIDFDENLLPDEQLLLERDFSIEIPRRTSPPIIFAQSPDNLPPLPWEVSRSNHGKRITLLPEIEEPLPKFDLIDDRFGEPLPVQAVTAMDVDQHLPERTLIQPTTDDRSAELLRAPGVERQMRSTDRYLHPSHDRTIDENRPTRSAVSELLPIPMETMDGSSIRPLTDPFTLDALAFFQSSLDVYPTYQSNPVGTVLLGAECSSSSDVPMIFIQEPTVIGADDGNIPMDTMPPLDQQLSTQDQRAARNNVQPSEQQIDQIREKETIQRSRKKRNAPNAITRNRKYPELYENIVDFDYEILKTFNEEQDQEFERWQQEEKPWPTILGRDGRQRMKLLIEGSQDKTTEIDFDSVFNEITKIANSLMNSDEPDEIAEARRTGQEIAIRRGQISGILPRTDTRPSSIIPVVEDRVSEVPIPILGGDVLPTFPSGFDEILIPPTISEPITDIRQPFSPIHNKIRDQIKSPTVQPSPTQHDRQRAKATSDIINLLQTSNGASFNKFLKESHSSRVQSARLFSILLALCAEQRVQPIQDEPYGDIQIFTKEKSTLTDIDSSDTENRPIVEPMEAYSDD